MKASILTYNVNGIRAAIGKGLIDFLREDNSDIVGFQELKASADQIPDCYSKILVIKLIGILQRKKGTRAQDY